MICFQFAAQTEAEAGRVGKGGIRVWASAEMRLSSGRGVFRALATLYNCLFKLLCSCVLIIPHEQARMQECTLSCNSVLSQGTKEEIGPPTC